MKVAVAATPAFALPTLEALWTAPDVKIVAVLTNPDRPRGRGLEAGEPPAKGWARNRDVPVFQPDKLSREALAAFPSLDLDCDALVVVASAFYVPAWLRALPRFGAVNLHPSLLPRLRGPAPINWAIINGLTETGVTTILLADEMDAGDILLQERIGIDAKETAGTLAGKLAPTGANLMLATLRGVERATITPRAQDHAGATYAPKITAETQKIDWDKNAVALERLIRGLSPEPSARTTLGSEVVQVLAARAGVSAAQARPGEVIAADNDGVTVACGFGTLTLLDVKPAGKKAMAAAAFARGRHIRTGARLGD